MFDALQKLIDGNRAYVAAGKYDGDVSPARRQDTARGQKPYAAVLTCSDSRVIPEAIFSAGNGDLFVIRVAGNVATDSTVASVEYAVRHLGVKIVLVLGHTSCGAVDAAPHDHAEGTTKLLTDEIKLSLDGETDPTRASERNARRTAKKLNDVLNVTCVRPALYDILTGEVVLL